MIRILLSVRLGEKRWSQRKLSRLSGVDKNTINDLYNEMTDRVNLTAIDAICSTLGCKLTDILRRVEDFEDGSGKR
jgi:putative transcriptional regulator